LLTLRFRYAAAEDGLRRHRRNELLKQFVSGFSCRFGRSDRQSNFVKVLMRLESQKRTAFLFFANHLSHAVCGIGSVSEIQHKVPPLVASQCIARQFANPRHAILEIGGC